MNRSQLIGVVVGLVVLVLLGSALYTVSEVDQVIITRFGQPVGDPVIEPGLHMKMPFIDTANRFEKRFLEWDGFPNQVPTLCSRMSPSQRCSAARRWRPRSVVGAGAVVSSTQAPPRSP